jgi:hypothetical protein
MFNEQVFWKDGFEGECQGGIFVRAVDLKKFMDLVESEENENGGEVNGAPRALLVGKFIDEVNPEVNDQLV